MYDNIIAVIERFGSFSAADKLLIKDRLKKVELKPGEVFIERGVVADKVGFLVSGILRYYSVNKTGNEMTINFIRENEFITTVKNFYYDELTIGTVQAETSCTLLYLNKEDFKYLNENVKDWLKALVHFAGEFLLEVNIFLRTLITEDAMTSYVEFLEKYPDVAKKVSLGHIASFLGITQSTLSRIRKQLVS